MTTPITKEQAEAVFDLRAGYQLGNTDIDILRKLAEYALAAMDAEPVSQPYKLPPNSFTDDELEMMSHGDNPQANAYRELLAFRRNSPVIPDGSANMLRRWLAFGRALQSSGSQLPRHLIAETESMLAAPQQEVTLALAKGMKRYGDAMQELAKKEVK